MVWMETEEKTPEIRRLCGGMRPFEEVVDDRERGNRWELPPYTPKADADALDRDVYEMECENYQRRIEGKSGLSYGVWRCRAEGRDRIDFGRKKGNEEKATAKNGRKTSAVL